MNFPGSQGAGLPPGQVTLNKWYNAAGILLAACASLLLTGLLYYYFVQNLDSPWTSVRLAPTFALSQGYPLYSTTSEPPWVMIGYGPFYPFTYGLVLLASTPTAAAAIGTLLAHAFILVPTGLLVKLAGGGSRMSWGQAALVTVMLYPVLLNIASVRWVTTLVHVDAPALGLLLVAALCLAHAGEGGERRAARLQVVGGIALGLAIACKANLAPAGMAFVLWLYWFRGIRGALVFAVASGTALALVYGAAFVLIDPEAILLNFRVLGNFPWSAEYFPLGVPQTGAAEKRAILFLKLLEISRDAGPVVLGVAVALFSQWRGMAGRVLPQSQAASLSALFLLLAVVMVVPAAASVAKWGGAPNSWALFTLPMTLSAVFALLHLARAPLSVAHPCVLLPCLLAIALGLARGVVDRGPGQLPALQDTIMERSYRLVQECNGTCYLPFDPLAHVLAGDTFRPNFDVISSYALGGHPVQKQAFRGALPARLEHIILASDMRFWGLAELKRISGFHPARPNDKAAFRRAMVLGGDFMLLVPGDAAP